VLPAATLLRVPATVAVNAHCRYWLGLYVWIDYGTGGNGNSGAAVPAVNGSAAG
jgi:hypothetical protein